MFIIMKLVILTACIGLPFIFTGVNCGTISAEELNAKMNLQGTRAIIATPATVQYDTCFDGLLSVGGGETDVDCGGSCGPCEINRGCALAADCSGTELLCNAVRAPPKHGLSSNRMALITSDCGTMRSMSTKWP